MAQWDHRLLLTCGCQPTGGTSSVVRIMSRSHGGGSLSLMLVRFVKGADGALTCRVLGTLLEDKFRFVGFSVVVPGDTADPKRIHALSGPRTATRVA